MRAGNPSLFVLSLSVALPVWVSQTGCSKEVKADFPRPPATASMGATRDEPEPEESPANVPKPEAVEAALPPETSGEAPSEPEVTAKAPPAPAKHREPAPEVSEPEPAPPSTQLAGSNEGNPELISKLRRASSLLSSIEHRQLSPPQEEQFMAARGFVVQARKALNDGDERRALVLIDKGLILAEDVERTSRP